MNTKNSWGISFPSLDKKFLDNSFMQFDVINMIMQIIEINRNAFFALQG